MKQKREDTFKGICDLSLVDSLLVVIIIRDKYTLYPLIIRFLTFYNTNYYFYHIAFTNYYFHIFCTIH